MMYGYGDVQEPLQESVDLVEVSLSSTSSVTSTPYSGKMSPFHEDPCALPLEGSRTLYWVQKHLGA